MIKHYSICLRIDNDLIYNQFTYTFEVIEHYLICIHLEIVSYAVAALIEIDSYAVAALIEIVSYAVHALIEKWKEIFTDLISILHQ